jgi:lysophospholipase L1-like esterase
MLNFFMKSDGQFIFLARGDNGILLPPPTDDRFNDPTMRLKSKRLIRILLVGLVLIAGAAAILFFRFARPMGAGAAGPAIVRESFSQPWSRRQVLLVGLGDSVTAGFGARKGYSYFDRLAKNPADEFPELNRICLSTLFPKLTFTNLAVSGSTSAEITARQLSLLPTNGPDVLGIIVVTTGGNDVVHNYGRTPPREEAMYGATLVQAQPWVENFGQRLESTLAQIKSRFPGGCEIFLANIFDPTDGLGDAERAGLPAWKDSMPILDAYNAVIRHTAETNSNVHVVDIHGVFLGHGIHPTKSPRCCTVSTNAKKSCCSNARRNRTAAGGARAAANWKWTPANRPTPAPAARRTRKPGCGSRRRICTWPESSASTATRAGRTG